MFINFSARHCEKNAYILLRNYERETKTALKCLWNIQEMKFFAKFVDVNWSHEVQKLCFEAFSWERCLYLGLKDELVRRRKTNSHEMFVVFFAFIKQWVAKTLQFRWNQVLINWILFSQFHFHDYIFISGDILIRFKFDYGRRSFYCFCEATWKDTSKLFSLHLIVTQSISISNSAAFSRSNVCTKVY